MEEKAHGNILATVWIIILLIVITVMGYYIYKIKDDKKTSETKANDLTEQVSTLNNTVSTLQNTISNISSELNNASNTLTNVSSNASTNTSEITIKENEFTITLPSSWKDKYELKTTSNENAKWYSFYDKKNEDIGGRLFALVVFDSGKYNKSDELPITLLKSNKKYDIYSYYPSDVQFNENNASAQEEYESMFNSVASILKTIELN